MGAAHDAADARGGVDRVRIVVSIAVVALIFGFLLPQLADYGDVWRTVRSMDAWEISTLIAVALVNILSAAPLMAAVLPGLRIREAVVVNLASTAVANTLPGGAALGVGVTVTMQRSWGFRAGDIALGAIISGIWNNFVKLGLPIVALGLLAVSGSAGAALSVAAVVGVLLLVVGLIAFALLLRSQSVAFAIGRFAQRIGGWVMRRLGRPRPTDWPQRTVELRGRTIRLLLGRGWRITTATVISHVALFVVLLVALRHIGVTDDQVSWIKVLAAFAFVRLLTAAPITPGGLGVVELGLTATLGAGLADPIQNRVATAVLVFRALTWFLPVPLGVASWIFWRANRSWRRGHDRLEPVDDVDLGELIADASN